MSRFRLRFERELVSDLAERYTYADDNVVEQVIGPRAKAAGHMSKADFVALCRWKTPRTQSRIAANSAELIEDTTRIALSTPHERLRIGVLTLLHGVSWPTASVVLHFGHRDPYPIIDYRALWSLGVEKRPDYYTFDLWWEYVSFCRDLAAECKITMRELDRALWQFSKENQG